MARRSRVCRSEDVQTDLKTDVRKVSNCGVNPDRGVHLMEAQENNAGTTAAAAAKTNVRKGSKQKDPIHSISNSDPFDQQDALMFRIEPKTAFKQSLRSGWS